MAIDPKIIAIQERKIILDSDIAELYGVMTKRINEAVKKNPDKFPDGYIVYLTDEDLKVLRSKSSTAKFSKTRVAPKAFSKAAKMKHPQPCKSTF